jgi:hypothetical protein
MLKASKHEATFKIRNRLRPVGDDHVIGIRCKHSNVLSRDVLISRFLLGNLRATKKLPDVTVGAPTGTSELSCYME